MKIAVAGGTGVAGRWTVDALRAGGHEAIVIARSAGVDLVTGEGLEVALAGADAVIESIDRGYYAKLNSGAPESWRAVLHAGAGASVIDLRTG